MAKLKVETNRDTELVRFDCLQKGEAFLDEGEACIKVSEDTAISLINGREILHIPSDTDFVTYVKRAELKLTI